MCTYPGINAHFLNGSFRWVAGEGAGAEPTILGRLVCRGRLAGLGPRRLLLLSTRNISITEIYNYWPRDPPSAAGCSPASTCLPQVTDQQQPAVSYGRELAATYCNQAKPTHTSLLQSLYPLNLPMTTASKRLFSFYPFFSLFTFPPRPGLREDAGPSLQPSTVRKPAAFTTLQQQATDTADYRLHLATD